MNKKLTRVEMRVALAKDVLKQIAIKKITPTHGVYVSGALRAAANNLRDVCGVVSATGHNEYPNTNKDMRDLLKGALKNKRCKVCAKGAFFLAHILRNDKVTLNEFLEQDFGSIENTVAQGGKNPVPAFTPRQLDEIEILFEGAGFISEDYGTRARYKLILASRLLRRKAKTATEKLAYIARLIIRNKGRKIVL